jgi:hypothetical protein
MNWFRYSGLWLTLIFNPLHWRIAYCIDPTKAEWPSPSRREVVVQIVMLSFRLVIDNGDW